MNPRALAIQGFRSFKTDTVLQFPGAGFYMLNGWNEVEPSLGGNGAGKSSVWDALCWVLYGKTTRGLRGPSIRNWEGGDLTSVMLEFEGVDGDVHELVRTQSPNSLVLDGRKVEQPEIDRLAGMVYTTFLNVVLMGQFNQFFFDLSPTAKLQMFTQALDLDVWVKAADKASKQASQYDAQLRALEAKVAEAKGRWQAKREQLREAKAKLITMETALQDDACDLALEATVLRCTASQHWDRYKQSEKVANALDAKQAAYRQRLIKLDDRIRSLSVQIGKLQGEAKACRGDLRRLRQQEKEAKGMDGPCPVCRREITHKTVDEVVDHIRVRYDWVEGEHDKLRAKVTRFESKLRTVKAKAKQVDTRWNAAEEEYKAAREQADRSRFAARSADERSEKLEAELVTLDDEVVQERRYVDQIGDDLVRAKGVYLKAKQEQEQLSKQVSGLQFWKGKFKDIRLWVVEQALRELEVSTNSCLVDLGLEDWRVVFDVERETKGGGLSRGFNVGIYAPGSSTAVPWEVWSGGETQRLRIAGAVGLSSLIEARRGLTVLMEVWDEPTAHLSPEGIEDLLRFLEERSRYLGRAVWLVDHRSLDAGNFDDSWTVVKRTSGSTIERS